MMQRSEIVFWQEVISPHVMNLAQGLARAGQQVTYVTRHEMTPDRLRQGWTIPSSEGVAVKRISSASEAVSLLHTFGSDSTHLTQGIRGNDYIEDFVGAFSSGKYRWLAMMETVDERFWTAPLKRLVYRYLLSRRSPDMVLAIGARMQEWVVARGFPRERVFPFAYFLAPPESVMIPKSAKGRDVQLAFVGNLIPRKRFDLLAGAALNLRERRFHLTAIGQGTDHSADALALQRALGRDRVTLMGGLPMERVRELLGVFDYLILPSDHDGWGAVVSEALMAGVPAICSDACGAAIVVERSRMGGVFRAGDLTAITRLMAECVDQGGVTVEQREALAAWARCLGAPQGTTYLSEILRFAAHGGERPNAPWTS